MMYTTEQPDLTIVIHCDFAVIREQERGPDPADQLYLYPPLAEDGEQELNQEEDPC